MSSTTGSTNAVLTVVSADVPAERADEVERAFAQLIARGLPDGLLRTELLRGSSARWQIGSLWRDRAALDAMRAGPEPPAAPELFRKLGATPSLEVFDLVDAASPS